jgi:hypothetical protein
MLRDPLHDVVQLRLPAVAGLTVLGMLSAARRRLGRRLSAAPQKPRGVA